MLLSVLPSCFTLAHSVLGWSSFTNKVVCNGSHNVVRCRRLAHRHNLRDRLQKPRLTILRLALLLLSHRSTSDTSRMIRINNSNLSTLGHLFPVSPDFRGAGLLRADHHVDAASQLLVPRAEPAFHRPAKDLMLEVSKCAELLAHGHGGGCAGHLLLLPLILPLLFLLLVFLVLLLLLILLLLLLVVLLVLLLLVLLTPLLLGFRTAIFAVDVLVSETF
ncbi:hypothetical protein BZA05DRAFT_216652 [Tricharina praecox]|uniref:uncharacterized protein n=1 Tax=Tricharina praecox TaxID=43433 RepID=UPI0022202C12|nr:uncharacterized protein BZA05DRAFT_216652 [Tricharina praecox]KAI5855734.1 hypothetical protein BZA05DRAFT_216652 [Tricharina praecox]